MVIVANYYVPLKYILVSHFFQAKVESAEKLMLETIKEVEKIVDGDKGRLKIFIERNLPLLFWPFEVKI